MTKSPMEGERRGLVVVLLFCFVILFCSFEGIRVKGPFELFNAVCFRTKRCYLLLAIVNDKETRIKKFI